MRLMRSYEPKFSTLNDSADGSLAPPEKPCYRANMRWPYIGQIMSGAFSTRRA